MTATPIGSQRGLARIETDYRTTEEERDSILSSSIVTLFERWHDVERVAYGLAIPVLHVEAVLDAAGLKHKEGETASIPAAQDVFVNADSPESGRDVEDQLQGVPDAW